MTPHFAPITPTSGLLSPFSSTATLLNDSVDLTKEKESNDVRQEVSPSIVLQKLQEVLS